MTFLDWANNRKWWEWHNPVLFILVAIYSVAEGVVAFAFFALLSGATFMTFSFIIDVWKWRALTMLDIANKQADILLDALKVIPAEKATELRARHAKLMAECKI